MNKTVNSILAALAGAVLGAGAIGVIAGKAASNASRMSDKHLALFLMMNQWVKVKQEGKNISDYFEKRQYKRVAVYGMSYAGETLIHELRNTNTVVVYGIDKKAGSIYADVDIVSMEDDLEEVDAIIVTAITFFDEIKDQLSKKVNCPVVSLENVLDEIS